MNPMRKEDRVTSRFGQGSEAAGWALVAALLSSSFLLPVPAFRWQQAWEYAVIAMMGAMNLLARGARIGAEDGPSASRREETLSALIGIGMIALLTSYLLASPASASLAPLYLLPIAGAALTLRERVVIGEAAASVISLLLLQAVEVGPGPFWTTGFLVRAGVFCCVSACLAAAAGLLRRAWVEADEAASDLSFQLSHVQALGALARQGALSSEPDRLADRAGEIVAQAAGADRHVVYLCENGPRAGFRRIGGSKADGRQESDFLAAEAEKGVLGGVLETGVPREIDGPPGTQRMLVLPLGDRQAPIGVICLLNQDGGRFPEDALPRCERLVGFTSDLLAGALRLRRIGDERREVERMARLLAGRSGGKKKKVPKPGSGL